MTNIKKFERKNDLKTQSTRSKRNRLLSNNSKSSINSSKSLRKLNGSYRGTNSSIYSKLQDLNSQRNYSLAYLMEKYLGQNGNHTQLHSQMKNTIDKKNKQIQTIKIYRDELKLINYLPKKKNSVRRIQLQTLKKKVDIQQALVDQQKSIKKSILELERQQQDIIQYCTWIISNFNQQSIFNLQEEKQILQENLQMHVDYLLRQLQRSKAKYAYSVKKMQQQIMDLRVQIKNKQNLLQQLRSKIFSLHTKLNLKMIPRQKNLLFSSNNNNRQQQYKYIYLGNNRIKGNFINFPNDYTLKKIIIFKKKKENIGIMPVYQDEKSQLPEQTLKKGMKYLDQILIQDLISLKIFYGLKIIGLEYRKKVKNQIIGKQFGQCTHNIQHKFLPLISKKIYFIIPHWHQQQIIGIGIQYKQISGSIQKSQKKRLQTSVNPQKKVLQQYFN